MRKNVIQICLIISLASVLIGGKGQVDTVPTEETAPANQNQIAGGPAETTHHVFTYQCDSSRNARDVEIQTGIDPNKVVAVTTLSRRENGGAYPEGAALNGRGHVSSSGAISVQCFYPHLWVVSIWTVE